MNIKANMIALHALFAGYQGFKQDNPEGKFRVAATSIDNYRELPAMTKQALGEDALDEVVGVMVGDGYMSVYTGNSTGSVDRAQFLANLLSNFPTFHSWMEAYLDVRDSGYMIFKSGESDEFLAIGPGFTSLEDSPHAIHESPVKAFEALVAQMDAQAISEGAAA